MAMKQGDRGPGVQHLQEKLNETGLDECRCVADGVYGKNTAYAVTMFQRGSGVSGVLDPLPATGVADADTLERLGLPSDMTAAITIIDSTGGGV